LKAFTDNFYRNYCNGGLESVKKTISLLVQEVHLEITTLIISDLNDDIEELTELFNWISDLNDKIPLHLSRYHPAYKLKNPPTNLELMKKAYKRAKNYLENVYLGNTIIENTADTFCSNCGELLIKREAYNIENRLKSNKCNNCGKIIYGEFN